MCNLAFKTNLILFGLSIVKHTPFDLPVEKSVLCSLVGLTSVLHVHFCYDNLLQDDQLENIGPLFTILLYLHQM